MNFLAKLCCFFLSAGKTILYFVRKGCSFGWHYFKVITRWSWQHSFRPLAITNPADLSAFFHRNARSFLTSQLHVGSLRGKGRIPPEAYCIMLAGLWLYALRRWEYLIGNEFDALHDQVVLCWELECRKHCEEVKNWWWTDIEKDFYKLQKRNDTNPGGLLIQLLFIRLEPWLLQGSGKGDLWLWVNELQEQWDDLVSDDNIIRSFILGRA